MFLHHVAIKYMCQGPVRIIKPLKSRREEHKLQLTCKILGSAESFIETEHMNDTRNLEAMCIAFQPVRQSFKSEYFAVG